MDDGDIEALAAAERQMAEAAEEAAVRRSVALAWLELADRDLWALERPCWGGVVDDWHRAYDALADSDEQVQAFRAFGLLGLP